MKHTALGPTVVQDYPGTLQELEDRFRTEAACRAYLAQLRWATGFACPRCGHGHAWPTARGLLQCRACGAAVSATAGTIFHRSHLPLRVWFRAIWWLATKKSGVSARGLQRTLKLGSYETAWACLHKLRRAMVRAGQEPLAGEVEVGDTVVCSEGKAGTRALEAKARILVGAEIRGRRIGRIRLQQIPAASGAGVVDFVQRTVTPGAAVITAGWASSLALTRFGYVHQPRVTASPLTRVHHVATLLTRWLQDIHKGRVSDEHLEDYLNEFTFRFNRRLSRPQGKLFHRLLQHAVGADPAPYSTLVRQTNSQRRRRRELEPSGYSEASL